MDQKKSLYELKQALQYRNRSKDILEVIAKGVQDLKFFKEKQQLFDPALYSQMLKKLQLKEYKKGEVVFHYGSNNVEQFYVILEGSVAILCPNDKTITYQQVLEEYQKGIDLHPQQLKRQSAIYSPRQSAFNSRALKDIIMAQAYGNFLGISNYSIIQLKFVDIQKVDQESLLEEYNNNPNKISIDKWLDNLVIRLFPSLHIVNQCNIGDQFGEIALIGNVVRTATVLCTQDTTMITLANPDFQAIIQQYHDQVKNEKISLLRNYDLFSKLSDKRLKVLLESITVQKLTMFNVIYYENTSSDYVYFIKYGEVELLKVINKNKTISISLLQVGCVFGHEEIQQQKQREYRAISKSSQCELYLLPAEVISQFEKKNTQSIEKHFHHQRLDRLLNDEKSSHKDNKVTQNSIQLYKTVFEKDYSALFSHELLQKRILSPKHKKMLSEPFIPFFDTDKKSYPSRKQSTERKCSNTNTTRYNKENSSRQLSTQTTINIHRHLFSPKISKRQLDTIMPFKRILQ